MHSRADMANQLMARGWGTVDELLAASFGEWPPRGLEITTPNTQIVELIPQDIIDGKDEILGRAREHERAIDFRKDLDQFLPTIMGHEATHVLQLDLKDPDRARDAYGLDGAQGRDQRLKQSTKVLAANLDIVPGLSKEKYDDMDYLRDVWEIQARIHQVLTENYPYWHRLPQTQGEFYAAITTAGLDVPTDLFEKMVINDPVAFASAAAFPPARDAKTRNQDYVDDINDLSAHLTPQSRARLWAEVMPRAYCLLIEMYGDKQGRDRFGLGHNEIGNQRLLAGDRLGVLSQAWQAVAGKADALKLEAQNMSAEDQTRIKRGLVLNNVQYTRDTLGDFIVNTAEMTAAQNKHAPMIAAMQAARTPPKMRV